MERLDNIINKMKYHGMATLSNRVNIQIDNAKEIFIDTFRAFLSVQNKEMVYLPEYDEIVSWLSNNEGKGLFLYGNIGRGKTFISRYIIPSILLKHERKVVNFFDVQEMNQRLEEVLSKKIICIDDVGLEELSNIYGNKRLAFLEVLDATEKDGKLLIVTSNLANTEQIIAKYGDRGLDRIIATTKRIVFKGNSLRK